MTGFPVETDLTFPVTDQRFRLWGEATVETDPATGAVRGVRIVQHDLFGGLKLFSSRDPSARLRLHWLVVLAALLFAANQLLELADRLAALR